MYVYKLLYILYSLPNLFCVNSIRLAMFCDFDMLEDSNCNYSPAIFVDTIHFIAWAVLCGLFVVSFNSAS